MSSAPVYSGSPQCYSEIDNEADARHSNLSSRPAFPSSTIVDSRQTRPLHVEHEFSDEIYRSSMQYSGTRSGKQFHPPLPQFFHTETSESCKNKFSQSLTHTPSNIISSHGPISTPSPQHHHQLHSTVSYKTPHTQTLMDVQPRRLYNSDASTATDKGQFSADGPWNPNLRLRGSQATEDAVESLPMGQPVAASSPEGSPVVPSSPVTYRRSHHDNTLVKLNSSDVIYESHVNYDNVTNRELADLKEQLGKLTAKFAEMQNNDRPLNNAQIENHDFVKTNISSNVRKPKEPGLHYSSDQVATNYNPNSCKSDYVCNNALPKSAVSHNYERNTDTDINPYFKYDNDPSHTYNNPNSCKFNYVCNNALPKSAVSHNYESNTDTDTNPYVKYYDNDLSHAFNNPAHGNNSHPFKNSKNYDSETSLMNSTNPFLNCMPEYRHYSPPFNSQTQRTSKPVEYSVKSSDVIHPLYSKHSKSDILNDSFESCLASAGDTVNKVTNSHFYDHKGSFKHPIMSVFKHEPYLQSNNSPFLSSNINVHPFQHSSGNSYEHRSQPFSSYNFHDAHSHHNDSVPFESEAGQRHILATHYIPPNVNRYYPGFDGFPKELSRKFNGNPLDFESWRIRVCQEIVDHGLKPNIACEYLLSQTSGLVKETVLQITNVEFNTSWNLVIEILDEIKSQFAQDHLVRDAIQKEIFKHPLVTENLESLNSFIRLCRKIELHKRVCGDLAGFDMAEGTAALRAKLPRTVQEDYGKKWRQYEERFKVAPPLSFLIEAVKLYRNKALSSRYAAIIPSKTKDDSSASAFVDRKIHMTESQNKIFHLEPHSNEKYPQQDRLIDNKRDKDYEKMTPNDNSVKGKQYCIFHNISGHDITECHGFLKLDTAARRDYIMNKGNCLNCFSTGHIAVNCPTDHLCKNCGRPHHELLHFDKNPQSQDARVGCTRVCGDTALSAYCAKVLLVDLAMASDPINTIRVYAIIDEQSDTTVVDERIADYFGGDFPSRNITTKFVTNKAVFKHQAKVMPDLKIKGVRCKYSETLRGALTYPSVADNKHQVATPDIVERFRHTAKYSRFFPTLDDQAQVLVLIGLDNIHIHRSDRLTRTAPYVHRTPLGYALVGKVCSDTAGSEHTATVLRTQTCDSNNILLEDIEFPKITTVFPAKNSNLDFDIMETRNDDESVGFSADDKTFLHLMKKGEFVNPSGNLTYPLPIIKEYCLPDNRDTIYRRTTGTLRSIKRSQTKLDAVLKIMEGDINAGNVEQLQSEKRVIGSDWYLPPFVVTHKRKGTPRLVFDAAAECDGISLNKLLLQGPDLLSGLRDVLLRFRERNVAVSGDIKGMFLNFKVDPEHRRFLRFFWYKENNPSKALVPYQINTHAFGLKSSPAVANYALKSIANSNSFQKDEIPAGPVEAALMREFYVDDLLTSTDTTEEASSLLLGVSCRLAKHGILLHKFASSHKTALQNLPIETLACGKKNLPDEHEEHSALGVCWDTTSDTLSLSLNLPNREFTKRGILSVIGSLYDPIGLISPVILGGRLFQREILPRKEDCSGIQDLGWDDPLPSEFLHRWQEWCDSLQGLQNLTIPRCLHPTDIIPVKQWLCAFSDASENAMGYVIYLRSLDPSGRFHLGFIGGTSRVAPRNSTTIPRMELNAALLAARAVDVIKKTFTRPILGCIYFTDSRIVLGYLTNTSKRFSKYVERRVMAITCVSSPTDWFYVRTNDNPADLATRPTNPEQLKNSIWFSGPRFLIDGCIFDSSPEENLPETERITEVTVLTTNCNADDTLLDKIVDRTNSLTTAGGIAQKVLTLSNKLDIARQRLGVHLAPHNPLPTVLDGIHILCKMTQEQHFNSELVALKMKQVVASNSPIFKLSPWLDSSGIIRMEGRLVNSCLTWSASNPIILPSSAKISACIVLHFHKECHHQGATITRSFITHGGFHIIGGSKLVKYLLNMCVICRKLRARAQEQKMSALPTERVNISPPFTNIGVDLFGPFHIKDTIATRRHNSSVKMWGCVFTCLSSRAVHLEALASLDAPSFLNALTRFCAIRGYPKLLKSDRGGNFVSASKKLAGIDSEAVSVRLNKMNIQWEFNPPHASHFGGSWERMIGSTRRVMEGMLRELHKKTIDMESFVTLLAEASRIINLTPLWVTSWVTNEPAPLCPADLLMINKSYEDHDALPVSERDLLAYGARRHRRAAYLVSVFWQRWESEYLVTLNQRSKWFREIDVAVGDIVMIIDENCPRSSWPLALITDTHPGSDGKIRSVTLRVGGSPVRFLERPVCKTISILPKRFIDNISSNCIVSVV